MHTVHRPFGPREAKAANVLMDTTATPLSTGDAEATVVEDQHKVGAVAEDDDALRVWFMRCYSNHHNVPTEEEQMELVQNYVRQHGSRGLRRHGQSAAYMLASGR